MGMDYDLCMEMCKKRDYHDPILVSLLHLIKLIALLCAKGALALITIILVNAARHATRNLVADDEEVLQESSEFLSC